MTMPRGWLPGLPPQTLANVQIFSRPSSVTNTQWMTYDIPRGRSMLSILCIGGGGGGGGGFTRTAGTAGGGGGGGGSSGLCRVIVPILMLPPRLYIQVGAGGLGVGSGGGAAGSGLLSYVGIHPDNATAPYNMLALSGSAGATGGGTGTGAAVGAAGVASTVATLNNMALASVGQFAFIAGQVGFAGGAVAGGNGTPTVFAGSTGALCQGGAGGAGTTSADFAGGACSSGGNTFLNEQRPATPAAGSFNGSGGPQIMSPFFSFGGLGGSSSNAAVGGAGGNGARGAGGGGGGAGTTGGRGGNGGDGIVIITCW